MAREVVWDDFSKGLWTGTPSDKAPKGTLKRALGLHSVPTASARLRRGSDLVSAIANVHSLYRFNNTRFYGTGGALCRGSTQIKSGLDGSRLSFIALPPSPGMAPWLFCAGGGELFKVSPSGAVTAWGLPVPAAGFTATKRDAESKSIETFNTSAAGWTSSGATLADEATKVQDTGSLRVTVAAATTGLFYKSFAAVDLTSYASGKGSPDEDYIALWLLVDNPDNIDMVQVVFKVASGAWDSGGDTTDAYTRTIERLDDITVFDKGGLAGFFDENTVMEDARRRETQPTTPAAIKDPFDPGNARRKFDPPSPPNDRERRIALESMATTKIPHDASKWVRLRLPKALFDRMGNTSGRDWSTVTGVKIVVKSASTGGVVCYFDSMVLTGSVGMQGRYRYWLQHYRSDTEQPSAPTAFVEVESVDRQPVLLAALPRENDDEQITHLRINRTLGDGVVGFKAQDITFGRQTIRIGSVTGGPFTTGETITGGTSGATGVVVDDDVSDGDLYIAYTVTAGVFVSGEVVTGGTSGATATTSAAPASEYLDRVADYFGLDSLADTNGALEAVEMFFTDIAPAADFFDAAEYLNRAWCLSSANPDRVYYSRAGRPESIEGYITVTSKDNPTQKLLVWNRALYVWTEAAVLQIIGSEPPFVEVPIPDVPGTTAPYTVAETPGGVVYEAEDGLRAFTGNRSEVITPEAISRVFQGESVELIEPFAGVVGAYGNGCYYISSEDDTLAVDTAGRWRHLGLRITALFFERDTKKMLAAWDTGVYALESEGVAGDDSVAIPFNFETPDATLDARNAGVVQGVHIEADTGGVALDAALIADGAVVPLGVVQSDGVSTRYFPLTRRARVVSVRVWGNAKVFELTDIALDVRPGQQT